MLHLDHLWSYFYATYK